MSIPRPANAEAGLRAYPSRWKGQPLLVCRRCEKRMKATSPKPLKLNKIFKRLSRKDPGLQPFHILHTACMDLCPKDGIAVCPQTPSSNPSAQPDLFILRTKADAKSLHRAQWPSKNLVEHTRYEEDY